MWKFEQYINNDSSQIPDWFNGIKIVEKLVVTYDPTYFSNSLLRDEIRNLYPDISPTYHWHTIAIEELEYFLGSSGENFIEDLKEKRRNKEWDDMNFREFFSRKYSPEGCTNPFLSEKYHQYFSDLDIV